MPIDACCEASCTCPACVNKAGKKQAGRVNRIYDRIRDISGLKTGFLTIVLTFPQELWTDDKDLLAQLRKAGRQVIREWIADVNGFPPEKRSKPGWTIAGLDVLHPAGDLDPEKWKPHIHVQIPALAWWKPAGDLDDRPSWKKLRLKMSTKQLLDLRVRWGKALESCGWTPAINYYGKKMYWKCNLKYHWFSGEDGKRTPKCPDGEILASRLHRVRYDFRHWPSWDGKIRKGQWWGFVAPARQPKAGIQDLSDKKKQDLDDRSDPCSCPKCGALAEWEADTGRDPQKMLRRSTRDKILELTGAPGWVRNTRNVRWYTPPPLKLFIDWRH